MTDREYLEMAAKAAGLRVGFEPDGKERGRYDLYWSNVHHQLVWHGKSVGSEYPRPIFWNPLNDNGQALELAVKLGISVLYSDFTCEAEARWNRGAYRLTEYGPDDPIAATRLAIVRAAAEIGKGTKPFPTAKEIREEWT